MNTEVIWIKGNVPSSKNSKVRTKSGLMIHSKQSREYYDATQVDWIDNRMKFEAMFAKEPKPWYVGFYFVRKSKHKFDYNNANQSLTDLMTKYEWIDDDNADEIKPVFINYHYDKLNPGVYIVNASSVKEEYNKLKKQIKEQL